MQIVEGYLLVADELEKSEVYAGREYLVKLDFLFHIINVPALSDIHGRTLIEINRCLAMVFREETPENLNDFIRKVFDLLKKCTSCTQYRSTILNCVITMAREVFNLNHHPLVDTFIEELILFGFQHPQLAGSTTEWQIRVNPAHIENIRSWLEIIAMKPRWTKRLLSALIINLKLGGVFVRDTDLLQKNISALLNTDISPAYNLVKQLLRLFPIYFSEIGAEGELREISTEVDELSFRQDPVIHFLRKQSHVESNSLLVTFLENAFRYWASGKKILSFVTICRTRSMSRFLKTPRRRMAFRRYLKACLNRSTGIPRVFWIGMASKIDRRDSGRDRPAGKGPGTGQTAHPFLSTSLQEIQSPAR